MFLNLKLNAEQQVWFTSDWHIQHKNLVSGTSSWNDKSGCRDFASLEEMENVIVSNYNSVVRKDDIVFNLGDVLFGDKTYLPKFLDRLNCRNIYLLRGNHDTYFQKFPEYHKLFLGVYDYLEVIIRRGCKNKRNRNFVLFHYPIASWNNITESLMCHGHSHGTFPDDKNLRRLDVGVDVDLYGHRKFFPFSLDELEHVMYNLKGQFKRVDHHNGEK